MAKLSHAANSTFLIDGGMTGAMMRAHDWSNSPLGPPESWPKSLQSVVSLMLNSGFPMFVAWGSELGFLYNDSYSEILGDKHPQALGRPFHDIWAEIWPDISPLVDAALAGEASFRENLPLLMNRHGYDEQTWFTFSYSPVRDETGNVAGMFCACTETTGQVLAERAVRESETRFRNMADHAPVMMWVTDESGYCTYLNRGWYEFTGQTAEEAEGFGWLEATHPADREMAERVFLEANATQSPFRVEYRLRRADGSYRWAIDAAAPRFGPSGEFLGYVGSVIDIDERRNAEAALRESEEKFRLMADAAPQIIWITDAEGGNEFFNRHWYEYTGAPVEPITARDVAERYVHPDDTARTMKVFDEARRTGTTYELEHRIRSADGEYRWFLVRGEPYRDPDSGRIVRWYGASTDIHDRRVAEQRLRELNGTLEQRIAEALAERKVLADLVETTDAFVQVADANFRWLAINPAAAQEFERIYGVRPKVGESMLDALAHLPEHQAAVQAVWSRALAGEAFTAVGEFGEPSRERRSYEMKYHVLRDAAGTQMGAYQFVYDVTDRVREQQRLAEAEAARRDADALYRAYFENSPEALFVVEVDPQGDFRVEQVNPAHEAALGFRSDEIRGKRVAELLPAELAQQVLKTYRHVVETGVVHMYREVFDFSGDPQHWDTSLVPMRDAGGHVVRLIGSSRNVTRQVMAEEALRQSHKMEAMGQLTGGVAHDFNNLLTPIVGSLDLLQHKKLGGEREQRLIAGAMQSAERARTLVQRLLAFARRQPLQAVPVDIAKLVAGMGELVTSTTGPQIRVAVETAEDLPLAMADPNQLEMALLNLSVNARDAMPTGGTLRISANAERVGEDHPSALPAGRYIRLSVADTGTGMDEATLARAIEPFFSTKGVGKGTGLGLSMVHGLSSQLGGALTIRSRLGVGTNVELWLPISTAGAELDAVAPPSPAEGGVEAGRGTALLVDDEDLVRLSTADMLADVGYRVVEASSAEEALRLFKRSSGSFDLLVTDHLMPGMNGTDLAREARALRPDLPVLIVSGYAESEGIAPDLPRLTKPFRKDELAASLAEVRKPFR
ncbi:PAS domain S-box protein [Sphingomonas sp. GCM10030256]|uniref:PAS domain S-box protein n=1 Tax=Sphingomonas sp. GCM10030256 TaxID=3273427 RepID=UPI003616FAC7